MNTIQNNPFYRNLILNMALVIIGYALATLTSKESNIIFQPLKALFLFYSMFQLRQFYWNDIVLKRVYIFSLLILVTIPFSVNIIETLKRVFTLILPMIYVATSMRVLFSYYTWEVLLVALLKSFRWIYGIPLISFLLFGGNLTQDIYGETIGAFVSNHYGWGAFMFIVAQWLLIQFKESKLISIGSVLSLLYLGLLFVSGSRSGVLSLGITFLIWFFSKRSNIFIKIIVASSIILITISLLNSNSVLSYRLDKTQTQYENTSENTDNDYYSNSATLVDARATARAIGSLAFYNTPHLFLTGMGIFQFKEGLGKYATWADPGYYRSGVHNSYGEIYFGCGILVFAYFLWFFIIKPLGIYFKYLRTHLLFVLGVFIIPFFESNITAGQFLFYPWFITIFFLLYFKDNYNKSLDLEE